MVGSKCRRIATITYTCKVEDQSQSVSDTFVQHFIQYLKLNSIEDVEIRVEYYIFPIKVVPEALTVPSQHKT